MIEDKQKIVPLYFGEIPWNKGLKGVQQHSEETKIKIGNFWKGKHCSEEKKRKIGLANSIALKGKKQSEETKRKRKETFDRIGHNPPPPMYGVNNPAYKDGLSRLQRLEQIAGRPKSVVCEICGEANKKICFDHDHNTGKFRGWICHPCNATLGFVRDKIETLEKIIAYLRTSQ